MLRIATGGHEIGIVHSRRAAPGQRGVSGPAGALQSEGDVAAELSLDVEHELP